MPRTRQLELSTAFGLMVLTIGLTVYSTYRLRELCLDLEFYMTPTRVTELTLSTGYVVAITLAAYLAFTCKTKATPKLHSPQVLALWLLVTGLLLGGYAVGAASLFFTMLNMSGSLI